MINLKFRIMITLNEFVEAIEVINKYRLQVNPDALPYDINLYKGEVEQPKKRKEISKNAFLRDVLSVRSLNAIKSNKDLLGIEAIETVDLRVRHLSLFTRKEFLSCRSAGQISAREIFDLADKANVKLNGWS